MPRRRLPPRAGALTELPPLRILRQIVLLQISYYVCAFVLILFSTAVAGRKFELGLLWSWQSLRGDNTIGWTLGLVWMLNSIIGVVFLLLLVSRSKLIPDFALTIHFIHLIVTILYSRSIPATWLWWCLQAASAFLMTSLGIWSCRYRELQPISFGGKANNTSAPSRAEQGGEGEGEGETYGRGYGGGRDGAGEYEMIGTGQAAGSAV